MLIGYRRFFKEGFWIVLGQVMMVTGSLVGVRLLTEILSPSSYGELALGMTIATLVNQTILGPLGGGISRFYAPAIERGDLSGYLNAARKLVSYAIGLIVLIAIASAVGLTIAEETQWVAITGVALLLSAISGCNAVLSGIQSAARQRAIVALHQGEDPWLRSLISVGLLLWLGATSTVAMVGYAIAATIILGSQIFFVQNIISSSSVNTSRVNNWDRKIWKFSWPVGIWGIFTWMQINSNRWALQVFSTTHDVGNYAVLYQLGFFPISLITGMVMQFFVPILYQRAGDASVSTRINNVNNLSWFLTWTTLGLTGLIFVAAHLFHALIFRTLVAEEYNSLSYLLPWIILAGGMFASGQSLASSLLAQMKTREMMVLTIATAVLGVILNFVGVYWYGISGLVGAGVIFSMLYLVSIVVLVKRVNI